MMKTTFHVLILDSRVAAVGGFLHRQNYTAEQMRTHTNTQTYTHTTTVRLYSSVNHDSHCVVRNKGHTQLHVWLRTTLAESARLSRLRAGRCVCVCGGVPDCTVHLNGGGEGKPPPPELHPSERRGAVWDGSCASYALMQQDAHG